MTAPVSPDVAAARAQAWALKDAVYAAWHQAPGTAETLAAELRALAGGASAGADDAEVQALADWAEGVGALAAGRLEPALARLRAAQQRFDALAQPHHAAQTRVPCMVALAMLGRDDEAQACGEAAALAFEAQGDLRSAAKVEMNRGMMLLRQDRHAEAQVRFHSASVAFARAGDREWSVAADLNLANTLLWQHRFAEAQQTFERVRQRAADPGFPVLDAQARLGLGRVHLHCGRWREALTLLLQAVEAFDACEAAPHQRLEARTWLADAYLGVDLLEEAAQAYAEVMASAREHQLPVEEAWATLQWAQVQLRQGRPAEARPAVERARVLYEDTGNVPCVALCDLLEARLLAAQQAWAPAVEQAARAEASLRDANVPPWWMEARIAHAQAAAAIEPAADAAARWAGIVADADALSLAPLHRAALAGWGQALAATGETDRARAVLTQALERSEKAGALAQDDELASGLLADVASAHDALVALALQAGHSEQVWQDVERGSARALRWSLRAQPAGGAEAGDASHRLHALRDRWRRALGEGEADRAPGVAREIQTLERDILEAQRALRLSAVRRPTAREAGPSGAPDRIASQAVGLRPGQALLQWHRSGDRVVACVVDARSVRHHAWTVPDLDERLRGLRFQLDVFRHGAQRLAAHAALLKARVQQQARALHDVLWAPVRPWLEDAVELVIVPHRELHYVPFAALHDGSSWLVQHHALRYAASAEAALAALQAAPQPDAMGQAPVVLAAGGAALPHAALELEGVAEAWSRQGAPLPATHASATRDHWLAHAPRASMLHLACHGQFRADNPAFSHLQLHDAPLTLEEIAQGRLQADLVVLSACDSGVSRIRPGNELLGLVRAFGLAGARAVIASHWPVDDAATAGLMVELHRRLAAGHPPSLALSHAQRAAAAQGAHPFAWAAFALHEVRPGEGPTAASG